MAQEQPRRMALCMPSMDMTAKHNFIVLNVIAQPRTMDNCFASDTQEKCT